LAGSLAEQPTPTPTPTQGSGFWFDGIIGTIATGVTRSDATGDDGYYKKGRPHSYTDNLDGTITDNNTGLMWVKDPSAAGVGGTYTWNNAISVCDSLLYADYPDWRLPTVAEVADVLDYNSKPALNDNVFGTIRIVSNSTFWTRSPSSFSTFAIDLINQPNTYYTGPLLNQWMDWSGYVSYRPDYYTAMTFCVR